MHLTLVLALACPSPQDEVEEAPAYTPEVHAATSEGRDAMARFSVPEGFGVELFAAEPHLANPVVFAFDERGNLYVAETFRHSAGVTDIRSHMNWLHEDLANETVEQRLEMMRRHEGDNYESYAREHDRVRRIVDTDGDGFADEATVFADGFSHPADGIGSGLLARGSQVWFACIPSLVLLVDEDGDGHAEQREVLQTGYGVNVSLLGHDLHGLVLGPDGRLYFTVGDRGLHVEHEGGTIAHPHTGAVLRCELDGSGLELYATGLRNPQELVFDERGDLFTGDNNSDGGDRARWVWVLPGSDTGWRYSYQYINRPNARGPWNAEEMWKPYYRDNADSDEVLGDQPWYVLPPIKNVASGPSGLTMYPGTGWGEEWRGTFFLCDFRGDPNYSGVHAYTNEPRGAGFRLVDERRFLWSSLVTDVDFGPDGGLYVSDWVQSWNKTGKGRMYRIAPTSAGEEQRAAASEVQGLLAAGFGQRSNHELGQLLRHADRRVRMEAQLALAARGPAAVAELRAAALDTGAGLGRLHGLWGLGHVARVRGRSSSEDAGRSLGVLGGLLADANPELRAQAAALVGEYRREEHRARLVELCEDSAPRVRLFAARALGQLGGTASVAPLIGLLERDAADPWLRTTAICALDASGAHAAVQARMGHESADVRRAVTCVLRRWQDTNLTVLLADADALVVREAVRAIYDERIEEAYPALCELPSTSAASLLDDYGWRRVINALRHVGGARSAYSLAELAARGELPSMVRREALEILAEWSSPHPLDRVTGAWHPIEERPADFLADLARGLAPTLAAAPTGVREAWVGLARRVPAARRAELTTELTRLARVGIEAQAGADTRVGRAALRALVEDDHEHGRDVLRAGLTAREEKLRGAAFSLVDRLGPDEACGLLEQALASGDLESQRGAFSSLGRMPEGRADTILAREVGRYQRGEVPAAVTLELFEAAQQREQDDVVAALASWRASLEQDDPLSEHRMCLEGGDPQRGRRVFFEKSETTCLRCHSVGADGGEALGGEAGPDLSDVGLRLEREALLTSILTPNAAIAEGFENWIVGIEGDAPVSGRVTYEDSETLVVTTKEGEQVELELAQVTARKRDLSGMPEDVSSHLSRAELRDLVAFLASLRAEPAGEESR